MRKGTVYLIHFTAPLAHARHYLGFTRSLEDRLTLHREGRGARLLAVINDAGIPWHLARVWRGDRSFERRLKGRKASARLCPFCCGLASYRRATQTKGEQGCER